MVIHIELYGMVRTTIYTPVSVIPSLVGNVFYVPHAMMFKQQVIVI